MDKSMAELEISSYGVVDTSLEEVFLKVTESAANAETGTFSLHFACNCVFIAYVCMHM